MTLKLTVTIPLAVPVVVKSTDGKDANRDSFTLKRPKLGHAKRLTALVGPQFASAFMSGGDELDSTEFVKEALGALTKPETLDGVLDIIADMCGEERSFLEGLDLIDLPKIGKAFIDFFPALQSIDLSKFKPTLPGSTDGDQTTSTS